MKQFLLFIWIFNSAAIFSQTHISGIISEPNGKPLPGANIYIKGSYDGVISDTSGHFDLSVDSKDTLYLIVSFVGYQTYEKPLTGESRNYTLDIKMEEESQQLNEVVISAGAFEASEKSRAVVLTPIDIATTASSDGDVYGALATFPGVQKQGESGMLIVRGGETYESKTYIDDLLISSPYISTMPDIPSRGRFSPFIFNGVMFSTGGYSAEYGQALSSVLELSTPGLFEEDLTSISLMNVGVGISHTKVYNRSSFSLDAGYNNLYAYFMLAKYNLDWIKMPESCNLNFYHRQLVGRTGLIKTNASMSHGFSKLNYKNAGNTVDKIAMRTTNILLKTSYTTELTNKWSLKTGLAYNSNLDNKEINEDDLVENLGSFHVRFGLKNFMSKKTTLKMGAEVYKEDYSLRHKVDSTGRTSKSNVDDIITAAFLEGDVKLNNKFAFRLGLRSEYSCLTKDYNAAPRFSLAFKPDKQSQIALACGMFFQQPQNFYLQYSNEIAFEKATHVLANYQAQFEKRFFRVEAYNKVYSHLITYQTETQGGFTSLDNNGKGFARGIDVFWKDNQTLPYLDYWVSYSYIDSKRIYKDYPKEVKPEFIATHSASIVLKYWINRIRTQACLTYNYSIGRPYNNPNETDFMDSRTPSIHDLSGSLSYITNIFGYFTVVHCSVSNILGLENIYSYRYSQTPDINGNFSATPVKSPIERTIIIGAFISIK